MLELATSTVGLSSGFNKKIKLSTLNRVVSIVTLLVTLLMSTLTLNPKPQTLNP